MVPPKQRLHAGQLARDQRHLRLVVEAQLPILQTALQFLLHGQGLHGLLAHAGVEQLGPRTAPLLGPVHRGVGVLDQQGTLGQLARLGQRHADAGTESQLGPAGPNRIGERPLQAVGHADGLEHAAHRLAEDGELVAAEAGHGVLGSQGAAQAAGHLAEHLVAGGMAEAVVDALEAIHVEEVDGRGGGALAPAQRMTEAIGEQSTVGETGEVVVERQPLELGLHPLAVGHVEEDAVEERVAAAVVPAHDGHLVADPDPATVGRAQPVLLHERLARAGAVRLAGGHARVIVGMHETIPDRVVAEPLIARVTEDPFDRGADEQTAPVETRLVDVCHRRQLLGHRPVAILDGAERARSIRGHLLPIGSSAPRVSAARRRTHGSGPRTPPPAGRPPRPGDG